MREARNVYLDHAATSPLLPEAAEALAAALRQPRANPSSPHAPGARARRALEEAREFLKGTLGATRLVFTSGATEANNLAIRGVLAARPGRALALATDHASLLEPLKAAAAPAVLLPVDGSGVVDLDALEAALDPSVRLLCLVQGNNETGALQPLARLRILLARKAPEAHLHLDWVQGYGRARLDLEEEGLDSLSLSGHKLGGPAGIGALALSPRARLVPQIAGGGQEGGLRAGTEDLPAILGLARAAEAALGRCHEEGERLAALRAELKAGLLASIPEIRIIEPAAGLPHILCAAFPGLPAEALIHHLAAAGIYAGAGAACSGGKGRPSHVLLAMGLPEPWARSALRFSLGHSSAAADVAAVLETLPSLVARLRRLEGRR